MRPQFVIEFMSFKCRLFKQNYMQTYANHEGQRGHLLAPNKFVLYPSIIRLKAWCAAWDVDLKSESQNTTMKEEKNQVINKLEPKLSSGRSAILEQWLDSALFFFSSAGPKNPVIDRFFSWGDWQPHRRGRHHPETFWPWRENQVKEPIVN